LAEHSGGMDRMELVPIGVMAGQANDSFSKGRC
jgi:hypothetical protein